MNYTFGQLTVFMKACQRIDNLQLHNLLHVIIVGNHGRKQDIEKMTKLLDKDG